MRHHSLPLGLIAAGLLAATTAQAGNESWVSGTGSDAGTCPRTAPCRTFQFAHDQTSNNGAINVLTPGNFGPLTITKPISIVAEGAEAVINTAVNGAAILVQAGGGAIIALRGLTIDLRGTGNTGIVFESGGALHVHNTVIRKAGDAIFFGPSAGNPELYIADSLIADSTSDQFIVQPTGNATASAVLDRVRIENGQSHGLVFRPGNNPLTATVRNSVISGHIGAGLLAQTTGATVAVMVDRTASVNNGSGVVASGAGATIRIGDSTVTGNQVLGLGTTTSGVIDSYGTNQVDGNATDGAPTNTIGMK